MKRQLFLILRAFNNWYWDLKALPRHIVGWSLVAIVIVGVIFAGYGICVGVYKGGEWAYETVCELFSGNDNESETEESETGEPASRDYYSGDYRHRKFPLGELNKKRNVNLSRDFKAINDTHLAAARRLGIKPQENRDALEAQHDKLVHLKNTRYYKLDPMTHSVPYLVPDAADFLTALGERWQEYHGTNSRYIITSCLRTEADVKRLKRGNRNATKDSAHRYGTTIDITYVRFDRRGRTHDGKLKADLARALYDMQDAGYCYVKYEYKQSCFHITVRP